MSFLYHFLGDSRNAFGYMFFGLATEFVILFNRLFQCRNQVGSIVEHCTNGTQHIGGFVDHSLYLRTGNGLDTAYAGSNARFAHDLDYTDVAGIGYVCTTAKLD